MSIKKTDTTTNKTETIIYSVLGGAICCYFVPNYIPICVCGGGLLLCTYGIISVLNKYENIEDMNFVEKEKVKYFKKK